MNIELEWVFLACFRLWQDGRPYLVTDPGTPSVLGIGRDEPQLEGEVVIASSLIDKGHYFSGLVYGKPQVINALDVARGQGEAEINGKPIVAVEATEAPEHPEGADPNALYAFEAGSLWFLHMGDLGYGLDADALKPFRSKCDVLLAITGERLTLKLDELDAMIDILQPKWIIPMHYNVPPIDFGLTTLDVFLRRRPRDPVIITRRHTVQFPLPRLKADRPTIVVLEPSGYSPTRFII